MDRHFFIAADGSVYEFDQSQIDSGYPLEPMREMTDEEVDKHLNPSQTSESAVSDALAKRDSLLAYAEIRIAPLRYAVDLKKATTEEANALNLWKNYQIDVNRVPSQPGFPGSIIWPEQPS